MKYYKRWRKLRVKTVICKQQFWGILLPPCVKSANIKLSLIIKHSFSIKISINAFSVSSFHCWILSEDHPKDSLSSTRLVLPPLHSLLLIPSWLFHRLLMQWFVLIVIYSHFPAEWCQQLRLLRAACFWIKLKKIHSQKSKTLTCQILPQAAYTDPRGQKMHESLIKNKMSNGKIQKNK